MESTAQFEKFPEAVAEAVTLLLRWIEAERKGAEESSPTEIMKE